MMLISSCKKDNFQPEDHSCRPAQDFLIQSARQHDGSYFTGADNGDGILIMFLSFPDDRTNGYRFEGKFLEAVKSSESKYESTFVGVVCEGTFGRCKEDEEFDYEIVINLDLAKETTRIQIKDRVVYLNKPYRCLVGLNEEG